MKQKFLLIGLLGILTFSCEKDNQKPKDEIIFKDLSPDIEIQTVRFYTPVSDPIANCDAIPTPTDSSSSFDLDLNNDQIMDFRILVGQFEEKRWRNPEGCRNFFYRNSIVGLSENNFVSINNDWVPQKYNFSDTISYNISNTYPPLISWHLNARLDIFNGEYIGIKINNSIGYIHVNQLPNRGIKIMDFGFNKTEYNDIICGQ
jgi:hypothetical protein